ncbi:unnamed protein product [Brachionus calyciflorus]|uniref:G-protein coupled receptors family 1 profile domain-containing protein n=1 Tax=Brachionus calyciflorus TaxID=104777 RepID=A0A814FPQ4_9BILA|nr:unnamed protein product [Brachionus calyciflorus]
MEHLKDSFIYMDLFIISIISLERYFAVCKPQYYKDLEANINKIIWVVYLLAFVFSSSNYFTDLKFNPYCSNIKAKNESNDNNNELRSFLNRINVILSTCFFVATAIISSFFYGKITIHQASYGQMFVTSKVSIRSKNSNNQDNVLDAMVEKSESPIQEISYSNQRNMSNASVQTDFNLKYDKPTVQKIRMKTKISSTKAKAFSLPYNKARSEINSAFVK